MATCRHGYRFDNRENELVLTCLGNRGWSRNLTDCIKIECGRPPAVEGSTASYESTSFESRVHYSCDDGLLFEDGRQSKVIQCSASGEWNMTELSCGAGRCHSVPRVSHALENTTLATPGTSVMFTCMAGHEIPGGATTQIITCRDGRWLGEDALQPCQKIRCEDISHDSGYTPDSNDTLFESRVLLTCATGHVFAGGRHQLTSECLANGSWSIHGPCRPVDCGAPPEIIRAVQQAPIISTYDNTVTYRCLDGYWFNRRVVTHAVRCTEDGTWSGKAAACREIRCPAPATWDGLLVSPASTSEGARVNASCGPAPDAAEPGGVVQSACIDGDWRPPLPECKVRAEDPRLAPVEASQSQAVGLVVMAINGVIVTVIIVVDAPVLYRHFRK